MSEIVTFGETMLRLSPQQGERLETASSLEFRTAGAESNVAIAASRLGADTAWVSKLPDNPLGRRVRGDLRQHGVTTQIAWCDEGRQGTYFIEQAGEPRGTNVIYDRQNAAITTAVPSELATDVIETAAIFYTTGITPALSETLYETTVDLLKTTAKTVFDLNYRSKLWPPQAAAETYDALLPEVDLLFAPQRDIRLVFGIETDAVEIASEFRTKYDCEAVVVTRGAEGAVASTSDGLFEQSAFETETLDPIGTGDAFVGGFLSRYIRGTTIEKALEYGAATAAIKRTIEGDLAVVTESEVEEVIERSGGSIHR